MADPKLVALLASQGSKAMSNPVARFALGLPVGGRGVEQAAAAQSGSPASSTGRKQNAGPSIQDKLFARVRTVQDTGFAVPGPGVLPGYALRPEVRELFKDQGGVSGYDVSNITPEEQQGLAMLLDPKWVAGHQGGQ